MIANRTPLLVMLPLAGMLLVFSAGTAQAQDPNHPPTCGGLNEVPCPISSVFDIQNSGRCDRGLILDYAQNACVNDLRRQGIGRDFQETWQGRALRIQLEDLNWDTPLGRFTWLSAHNAYNNYSDGYSSPNQRYSVTELLDAGIRSFAIDIHIYGPGPQYPRLCHSIEGSSGCSVGDRWFANMMKEIKDWLLEPGHEDVVLLMEVQNQVPAAYWAANGSVNDAIEVLQVEGIGVLRRAELAAYRDTLTIQETKSGDEGYEWPSQRWLVENNKRVVFVTDRGQEGPYLIGMHHDGVYGSAHSIFNPSTIDPSDCRTERDLQKFETYPLSGRFDFAGVFPDQIHKIPDLVKCNVDVVSVDGILDDTPIGTSPAELATAVWSWAENMPPVNSEGMAAVLHTTSGRWTAVVADSGAPRPFLCRKDDRGTNNIPTVAFSVTSASGPWEDGVSECLSLGATWRFAPPRNGYENALAHQVLSHAPLGVGSVWLNFVSDGPNRWYTPVPLANAKITAMGTAPGLVRYSLKGVSRHIFAVWTFSDGTVAIGKRVDRAYAIPGVEVVKVRVIDQFLDVGRDLEAAVIVGFRFEQTVSPAFVLNGPLTVVADQDVRFTAYLNSPYSMYTWIQTGLRCGTTGTVVRTGITPDNSLGAFVDCRFPHSSALRTEVVEWSFGSGGGGFATSWSVNIPPTPVAGPQVEFFGPTSGFVGEALRVSYVARDADGTESQRVTQSCGPAARYSTWGSTDGVKFVECILETASPANPVSLTVKDAAGRTTTAERMITILDPTSPTVEFEGATVGRVGDVLHVLIVARNGDGTPSTLKSSSCGPAATVVETGVIGFPYINCRLSFAIAANPITVTVEDAHGNTTTATRTIEIIGGPTALIDRFGGPIYEGEPVEFFVMGWASLGDNVTLAALSCGGAPPLSQSPDQCTGGASGCDAGDLKVTFTCRFPDGPAAAQVTATLRDSDAETVTSYAAVVLNRPPSVSSASFPDVLPIGAAGVFQLSVHDPGADSLTSVSFDWGDGTASAGHIHAVWPPEVTGTHTWSARGTYLVGATVTDSDGESSYYPMTVRVRDTVPPVLSGPAELSLPATSLSGRTVTLPTVSATDNLDGAIPVTCTPSSGTTFPIGTTTVTCTATDSDGNVGSHSYPLSIWVNPPFITPNVVPAPNAAGWYDSPPTVQWFISVQLGGLASTTGCQPVTITEDVASLWLTCTATSGLGLTSSAQVQIKLDRVAPTLALLEEGPVGTDRTNVFVAVSDPGGEVAAVTIAGQSASKISGNRWRAQIPLPVAGTPVVATATDGAGNATTLTLAVDGDGIPAAIDRNRITGADESSVFSNDYWLDETTHGTIVSRGEWPLLIHTGDDPSALSGLILGAGSGVARISACAGSYKEIRLDRVQEAAAWTCDSQGRLTVSRGPASSGEEIEVDKRADAEGESFTRAHLSSNQVVSLGSPISASPNNTAPMLVEVFKADGVLFGFFYLDPGEIADVELTTFPSGAPRAEVRVLSGAITITTPDEGTIALTEGGPSHVFGEEDTLPPSIDAVADQVHEATSAAGAIVSFALPAVTDNTDPSPALAASPAPGSLFALGATTVTLTATDAAGNNATRTFTITVRDTTPPAIDVPGDVSAPATSADGAVVVYTAPATQDLVDGAGVAACAPASGSMFAIGSTTVTCTAADTAGNEASTSFTVTVTNAAPAITVPANMVRAATSADGAVVTFAVSGHDAEDGSVAVTCTPASGATFPIGATDVACSATDAIGSTAAASFRVTVVDPAPIIDALPVVTVEATGPNGVIGIPLIVHDIPDGPLTATCSIDFSGQPDQPADSLALPIGSTMLQCRATDSAGQTTVRMVTANVRDTIAPVIAAHGDLNMTATSAGGAVVTYAAPATQDLVGGAGVATCMPASGATFPIGTTPVVCEARDAAQNLATSSFTVTVSNNAPTFTAPPSLTREATGAAGAVVGFTAGGADVEDGPLAAVCAPASGSTFPLGTTPVNCTVTDAAGATASGTFAVTVVDTTAPVVTVPANLSLPAAGAAGAVATFAATAVDTISGSRPVTCAPASGSTFPIGTTTVACAATDAAGNSASASFTVTVTAAPAPTPVGVRVRQAPVLNGGTRLEGSIQVMQPGSITLNGSAVVTGDMFVTGSPTVKLNGKPTFGGVVAGSGAASPSNYQVTLNGGVSLGRLMTRTDAEALAAVPAPPVSTGTRNVSLNKATDSPGAFATLRDLTLNGNVGAITVPAGTYGKFVANGSNRFVLGTAGATTPAVYHFQQLQMNGDSRIDIVGPVVIVLKEALTINGNGYMGAAANPLWLTLKIASGGLTLNGNTAFYGVLEAPSGQVTLNGGKGFTGRLVSADRLTLNGSSKLVVVDY